MALFQSYFSMGAGGHVLEKRPAKTDVGYGPSEDARIRWKLDVHMMPLFFVLCMFVPLNPSSSLS